MALRDILSVAMKCAAIWLLFDALKYAFPILMSLPYFDSLGGFWLPQALGYALTGGATLLFSFFIWMLGRSIARTVIKEEQPAAIPLSISAVELEGVAFRILGVCLVAVFLEKFGLSLLDFMSRKEESPFFPWRSLYGIVYSAGAILFGLSLLAKPAQFAAFLDRLRKET